MQGAQSSPRAPMKKRIAECMVGTTDADILADLKDLGICVYSCTIIASESLDLPTERFHGSDSDCGYGLCAGAPRSLRGAASRIHVERLADAVCHDRPALHCPVDRRASQVARQTLPLRVPAR